MDDLEHYMKAISRLSAENKRLREVTDDMVERGAAALYAESHFSPPPEWGPVPLRMKELYRDRARRVLVAALGSVAERRD